MALIAVTFGLLASVVISRASNFSAAANIAIAVFAALVFAALVSLAVIFLVSRAFSN